MSSAGVGFGMMYLPAIVIVSFYFDRRRSLATGISVCGSSVGGFIVPPMLEHLIRRYGWPHTSFAIAAAMLLGAFAGMLFKPILLGEKRPNRFLVHLTTAQSRLLRYLRETRKSRSELNETRRERVFCNTCVKKSIRFSFKDGVFTYTKIITTIMPLG